MRPSSVIAWLPLVTLPTAVVFLTPTDWPRWRFMWVLAFAIFAGCKWLTWWTTPLANSSIRVQIGYLFAWPGMDAGAFFSETAPPGPRLSAWLFALAKFTFGILLIFAVYPTIPEEPAPIRGWVGMTGILFVLHFGAFDLLSLMWRANGVNAKPIMDWPVLATSVSDFWGRRWNLAFRDLTHRYLFRPLTARFGAKAALFIGFLFSGLVHDLVISLPAHGGCGGPTLFFLLQGIAIFVERSDLGRRFGLGDGIVGWMFTMLLLLLPLPLLFHSPFIRDVIVPFLDWIQP